MTRLLTIVIPACLGAVLLTTSGCEDKQCQDSLTACRTEVSNLQKAAEAHQAAMNELKIGWGAYGRDLKSFQVFCDGYFGGPLNWNWATVDRLAMRGFMGDLARRGLAKRTVARAVSALRAFYRFLSNRYGVEENPATAVRIPKLDRRLPAVLDRAQIDVMFEFAESLADQGGFRETRDLAILEVFYATGMRLSELAGLDMSSVDIVSGQAKVRDRESVIEVDRLLQQPNGQGILALGLTHEGLHQIRLGARGMCLQDPPAEIERRLTVLAAVGD